MRRVYSLFLVVPFVLLTLVASPAGPPPTVPEQPAAQIERGITDGRRIFRYDTFGDEQLWTNVLRMHDVVATVPPATALGVGLKVDVEALPEAIIAALRAGQVDLTNPAVTIELLRLNAVVGVRGKVNDAGQLTSVGITCALCHSSVDNSFYEGHRQAAGWMGEHRSERGGDRRPLAGAGSGHQSRVQRLGSRQI